MKTKARKLLPFAMLFILMNLPLLAEEPNPDELATLISTYDKDLDDALDMADELLKTHENSAELWYWKGRIHAKLATEGIFSAISNASDAKDAFIKANELEPNNAQYTLALSRYYSNAPSVAGGDIEKAKSLLNRLYKIDPREGLTHLYALSVSQEAEAERLALLDQGIKELNEYPDFYFLKGIYLQEQAEYSEAKSYFKQAMTQTADDDASNRYYWNALYQLGRTAVLAEEYDNESIQAYERYINELPIEVDAPSADWAQYRLAQIYAIQDEAKAYSLIKTIDSEDKELIKAIKKSKKRWRS